VRDIRRFANWICFHQVDLAGVETNIVIVEIDGRLNLTAAALVEELEKRYILALPVGTSTQKVAYISGP
jgi:hypothetical protein